MSQILGRAPMSPAGYAGNYSNPTLGGVQGAMAGAGFGNKYGQQLSNFFGGLGTNPPAQRPGATYWPSGPGYDPSF